MQALQGVRPCVKLNWFKSYKCVMCHGSGTNSNPGPQQCYLCSGKGGRDMPSTSVAVQPREVDYDPGCPCSYGPVPNDGVCNQRNNWGYGYPNN